MSTKVKHVLVYNTHHQRYPNIFFSSLGGVQLRLSGGTSPAEGRVDIKQGGKWGSLCDKNFGLSEAQVLCSMLGYRYILKNKTIFLESLYQGSPMLMIKKQNEDRDGV